MRQRALLISLFLLLGVVATPGSLLAGNFSFECKTDRYVSVPLGQGHQFLAPISAVAPGNDSVDVTFETHLPDFWGAQWCHSSTGLCYFSDQRIRLVVNTIDRLEIDIFPDAATAGMGWIDITIRSVEDPLEVARCTYTLYSGMPVPDVAYTIDSSDNTRWLITETYTEFFSPIRNNLPGGEMDTLLVRMIPTTPGDWVAQFCQVSTGICFFDRGELPIWTGLDDDLHLQIWYRREPEHRRL